MPAIKRVTSTPAIFNTERAFTFDGVMKYDNESGVTTEYLYGANRHGGEAVFAPKVGAVSEDDGYLVCFVHDEAENQSECHIIDAQRHQLQAPSPLSSCPLECPMAFMPVGWALSDRRFMRYRFGDAGNRLI